MATASVRKRVFQVESHIGVEKALIDGWNHVYCGYGVHEFRLWDRYNKIPKVPLTDPQVTYELNFSVMFMHQWMKYELKHVDSDLVDSVAVLTYGLYHNVSTDLPFILMRGNAAGSANIIETFQDEEFVYPPQTYRFMFNSAVALEFVEPRFTLMERF